MIYKTRKRNMILHIQPQEKFEHTKVQSEANNRGTDNAKTITTNTKGQTMIYKTLYRKLKIILHIKP